MEEQLFEYLNPEVAILVPVLWVIGKAVKSSKKIKDKYIPIVVGVIGVCLCTLYQMTVHLPVTPSGIVQTLFFGITQGVICGGLAVYSDQIAKQLGKEE